MHYTEIGLKIKVIDKATPALIEHMITQIEESLMEGVPTLSKRFCRTLAECYIGVLIAHPERVLEWLEKGKDDV